MRRIFLSLALAVAVVVRLSASYALVGSPTAAGNGRVASVTTTGFNTSGADFIAIAANVFNPAGIGAGAAIADSVNGGAGNTGWTALTTQIDANLNSCTIWYVRPSTVGANHTFTLSVAGTTWMSLAVAAFSGSVASPFDVESGTNVGSGTSAQPGSLTPTQANDLIINCLGPQGAVSSVGISPGTVGVTITNNGAAQQLSLAYEIRSSSSAASNPTWSWTTSTTAAVSQAAFKSTGGAATPGCKNGLVLLGAGCEEAIR